MLLECRPDLGYSISATTRAPRPNEVDGRDYHFLSRAEFERRLGAGEFVEHAAYGGHLYGTLRSEIEAILKTGRLAVLDVEIEGARQLRRSFPDAVEVFVLPPSADELVRRLTGRNTEDAVAVRRRLDHAAEELGAVSEYDYVIVNDDLPRAVAQVSAIVDAEARRVPRQDVLPDLVAELRRQVLAQAVRYPMS